MDFGNSAEVLNWRFLRDLINFKFLNEGGFAQMNCVDKEACLTFPIMLRGMSCSYDFR